MRTEPTRESLGMLLFARMPSARGHTASRLHMTAAVAVMLVLGACADDSSDTASEATVTFTSPVYGYSISHPAAWSVVDADRPLSDGEPPSTSSGATDIFGQDASVRVSTMQLPGVIIAAQPVPGNPRIDDWTSSILDTVKFMKGCESPNKRDDVEIGGESGTLLTYRDCPPDLGYLHLWAGVVHEGRGFHIVWFNDPGHEDEDRSSFEQMLASMSFDE